LKGIFTISLDFELHWGGFEKWPLESRAEGIDHYKTVEHTVPHSSNQNATEYLKTSQQNYRNYFLNTRLVIPQMLELFATQRIHVTWATVGLLFHRSQQELDANIPARRPTYHDQQLSAYRYIQNFGIGQSEQDDPFHYAASLVEKIIQTPHQELASHTFSHFYCNEPGQDVNQFRDDLRAAQRVAASYGKKLASLVFPRNQFNDQYLKVCFEEGITSVRSNPLDWFWHIDSTQSESKWKRLNRGLDAYLPIGKKNTYKLSNIEKRFGFPVSLPASRLLRPYNPKEYFLNSMKISRIKNEMERAARQKEVYHLWWHPHNFGHYPHESLMGLTEILDHYSLCKRKWGMESLTMNEMVSYIGNT
jgi:hypothetical protein